MASIFLIFIFLLHFHNSKTVFSVFVLYDKKPPNQHLDMRGLALGAITAFLLYRIISACFVYKYTRKWYRFFTQLLDLGGFFKKKRTL